MGFEIQYAVGSYTEDWFGVKGMFLKKYYCLLHIFKIADTLSLKKDSLITGGGGGGGGGLE